MNASGEAVREAMAFYKLTPEDVFVISDDTTLDVGKMRIRKKGSAGGHNGLKSIIEQLGTDEFPRIKIGVGQKPSPEYDLADWVLGKFPASDIDTLKTLNESICDAVIMMLDGNIDGAMSKYSR
jgi:PTH1 family peptidyl-tRNA hydrolase